MNMLGQLLILSELVSSFLEAVPGTLGVVLLDSVLLYFLFESVDKFIDGGHNVDFIIKHLKGKRINLV